MKTNNRSHKARSSRRLLGIVTFVLGAALLVACGPKTETNNGGEKPAGETKEVSAAPAGTPAQAMAQARDLIKADRAADAVFVLNPHIVANPNDAELLHLRGVAYARTGALYPAIVDLNAAAAIAPTARTYYNLGNVLQHGGYYTRATTAYQASLELAPNDPETLSNYGNALRKADRDAEAQQIFRRAIEQRPNDPEVHLSLALTYYQSQNYGEMERLMLKALELDPDFWQADFNLGKMFKESGDYTKSEYHYRQYLKKRPDAPDWRNVANSLGISDPSEL